MVRPDNRQAGILRAKSPLMKWDGILYTVHIVLMTYRVYAFIDLDVYNIFPHVKYVFVFLSQMC